MDITINGKAADITIENEKTLGDLLAGLEQWLAGSGSRLSGLLVDGEKISAGDVSACLGLEIVNLKNLDILVSTWGDLAAEALETLHQTCEFYGAASFEDRGEIEGRWLESPAAGFLAQEIPEMAGFAGRTLRGEGLSPADLGLLTEERLRELENPAAEIAGAEGLVSGIAGRMEELPLDIQTGKDNRAVETMQLFSRMGEKLFRLLFILETEGLSMDTLTVEGQPAKTFIDEFSAALKELSAAYENKDSVLVGDLSEYELAPRLLKFYSALRENAPLSLS
jgi:hypothetical protein